MGLVGTDGALCFLAYLFLASGHQAKDTHTHTRTRCLYILYTYTNLYALTQMLRLLYDTYALYTKNKTSTD